MNPPGKVFLALNELYPKLAAASFELAEHDVEWGEIKECKGDLKERTKEAIPLTI